MSTKEDLDAIWSGMEQVAHGRAERRIDDSSMDAYLDALAAAADDLPDTCGPVRDALAALRDDYGARTLDEEQLSARFRAFFDTMASVRGSVCGSADGEIRSRIVTLNITESAEDVVCQVDGNGSSTEQIIEDVVMALTMVIGRGAESVASAVPEPLREGVTEIARLTLVSNVAKWLMENIVDGADKFGGGTE